MGCGRVLKILGWRSRGGRAVCELHLIYVCARFIWQKLCVSDSETLWGM